MPLQSPPALWPDPVIEWTATSLVDADRPERWVREFAERIEASGLPIARLRIMIRILHPQLAAMSFKWRRGEEEIFVEKAKQGLQDLAIYTKSPALLLDSGQVNEIRRSLERPNAELEFPILKDLKDEGMTDYLALAMPMSIGRSGITSLATDRPCGFREDEVQRLREIVRAATHGVEIMVRHETALSLIRAYLGQETGTRVLAGSVKRGDGQTLDAVIWYSDLRHSTMLSEDLPLPSYLSLLNQYFDCLAGPVLAQGGEVLHFIGDAVLAIFPVTQDEEAHWSDACQHAMNAAREASRCVDELNAARLEQELEAIDYGIGLHLGSVHYGNVGTVGRVEFTVIGRDANEAAKIEAMTKSLHQRLVVSEAFTRYHTGPWRYLGEHPIAGTRIDVGLYAPRLH